MPSDEWKLLPPTRVANDFHAQVRVKVEDRQAQLAGARGREHVQLVECGAKASCSVRKEFGPVSWNSQISIGAG
jgi:hypothetical protein